MTTRTIKVDAGEIRHLAQLQEKSIVDDGSGGLDVTWTKTRDLWCRIRPLSVVQQLEGMRRQFPVTHEILARASDDLDTEHRIVFGGTEYRIEGVLDADELGIMVTVLATKGKVAT